MHATRCMRRSKLSHAPPILTGAANTLLDWFHGKFVNLFGKYIKSLPMCVASISIFISFFNESWPEFRVKSIQSLNLIKTYDLWD